MNIIPLINKVDKHGKTIVWEQGEYSIAVNTLPEPSYVTLWYQGERMGSFYVDIINKSGTKWYKVSSVHINQQHKGKGLGKRMYQVLLSIKNDVAGIYSYLPDRSNTKQIPKIYKALNGYVEDGDHAYIPKIEESKMNNFEKTLLVLEGKKECCDTKDCKDAASDDKELKKNLKDLKKQITNHDEGSTEYKKINKSIKDIEKKLSCCKDK